MGEASRLSIAFLTWRDVGHPDGGGSEVYVESVARNGVNCIANTCGNLKVQQFIGLEPWRPDQPGANDMKSSGVIPADAAAELREYFDPQQAALACQQRVLALGGASELDPGAGDGAGEAGAGLGLV